jgi:hypothetical protein
VSDGIVLDHLALLALAGGNRQLSGFVVAAHEDPLYTVFVPALCLAEATRHRPGISAHLAHLPAVEVSAVDRIVADTMGRLAAVLFPDGEWPVLHAVALGLATGWEIATTVPGAYKGFGVAVMPVRSS